MAAVEPIKSLLKRWKIGDQSAAERLYSLYSERLWILARSRIDARLAQRVGASDVVQSAFQSFFRLAKDGEIQIDHSESVWRLLAAIAVNKVRQQQERHNAGKRSRKMEVRLADLRADPSAFAHAPTPLEELVLADELESLLSQLKPPEPEILSLCLQGFSPSEIALQVRYSRWSVRRVLNRIGRQLERRFEENSSQTELPAP
jgi:RNA polymerase sigma factor (sigma-70 family)